jgi:hypothetical protein
LDLGGTSCEFIGVEENLYYKNTTVTYVQANISYGLIDGIKEFDAPEQLTVKEKK